MPEIKIYNKLISVVSEIKNDELYKENNTDIIIDIIKKKKFIIDH